MKSKRPIYLLSPKLEEGVISLPMIGFESVAKEIDFSSCDILMFTSKEAVKRAESIDPNWKMIPTIAIGEATKKEIELLGGSVVYSPDNFYAQQLAEDISRLFADSRILYLRPKKISFDSKGYLAKKGIVLQEQIIYKTDCICYEVQKQPPKNSVIIFTSPSTIDCFLESFDWLDSYTAVVIGKSTKEHLPKDINCTLADKPLISACIEKAEMLQ